MEAEVTEMRTWTKPKLTEALQQRQLDTNGLRGELMDRLEDAIRGRGDASPVVQAVAASVILRARVSLISYLKTKPNPNLTPTLYPLRP